jgi:hypothetical protein
MFAHTGKSVRDRIMWIEEFVSHLKKSTVATPRLEQALALKDVHLPKYLYKYQRIKPYSLTNLRDDTVWICSPEAYNDPYDCLFRIAEAEVVTAAKRGLVKDFVRLFKLREFLSPHAIKLARASDDPLQRLVDALPMDQVFPSGSDPVQMAQFTSIQVPKFVGDTIKFIHQIRDATKVCSFTERSDSIVMWSHYADYHKGFCIEYDISQLPTEHLLRRSVFPAVYSAGLFDLTQWAEKLVSTRREQFNPALVLLAMMSKHKDWKYEREWRFVLTEPRLSDDRALPVPKPTRVLLGSRMPEEKKTELTGICTTKGIEVWQMERVPDAFELRSVRVV